MRPGAVLVLPHTPLPGSSSLGLSQAAMMLVWFRDHVLPGLITAAILSVSHVRLWRRIKKLTEAQTRTLRGSEEDQP